MAKESLQCLCRRRESPNDWMRAMIVPIYKGKGDRSECKNYRGISLLSIPGSVRKNFDRESLQSNSKVEVKVIWVSVLPQAVCFSGGCQPDHPNSPPWRHPW